MPRDLLWTYEEVFLALDLYVHRPPGQRNPSQREVESLARLLDRSADAVVYKLKNIAAVDPEYPGVGFKHGGSLEKPLFEKWARRPGELRDEAERIRAILSGPEAEETADKENRQAAGKGGPPLFRRFEAIGTEDLEKLIWRNRSRAKEQSRLEDGRRKCESYRRRGQGWFDEAVFAQFYLAVGPEKSQACPGCGHSRVKTNGDPLLEAHHVIPWTTTQSMDSRWGIPLCPNCHWLAEIGSLRIKRGIYRNVRVAYPQVLTNLDDLRAEGALDKDQERWLGLEGLL